MGFLKKEKTAKIRQFSWFEYSMECLVKILNIPLVDYMYELTCKPFLANIFGFEAFFEKGYKLWSIQT